MPSRSGVDERISSSDLEEATIRVRHALQRGELVPTKTEKSRRTIDLYPGLVDVLRRHKVRQAEALLYLGRRQDGETFVFASGLGEPLSGTAVTHRFQDLLERAGLRRIRFHDLRHLTATVLPEAGVDLRVVAEEGVGRGCCLYDLSHLSESLSCPLAVNRFRPPARPAPGALRYMYRSPASPTGRQVRTMSLRWVATHSRSTS